MLERIGGFDWDMHNVSHVARHCLEPIELEEAVTQRNVIVSSRDADGEKRWKLFGKSSSGRYLTIVFTIRGELFRPITAHTMNQKERKIYAPEIDG